MRSSGRQDRLPLSTSPARLPGTLCLLSQDVVVHRVGDTQRSRARVRELRVLFGRLEELAELVGYSHSVTYIPIHRRSPTLERCFPST